MPALAISTAIFVLKTSDIGSYLLKSFESVTVVRFLDTVY